MATSTRATRFRSTPNALIAALLGLVLFADVSQAGASYVYCRAMDTVMGHACCGSHAQQPERAAQLETSSDCCQTHQVQALAPSTNPPRGQKVHAPVLALLRINTDVAPLLMDVTRAPSDGRMRTGPPPTRARARLMVFQV